MTMRALSTALLILLAACAATGRAPEAGPLGAAELHRLYDDGFVARFRMLENRGRLGYRPDGTMMIKGFALDDGGSWRIDGERRCQRWQRLRGGVERCLTVVRADGHRYMLRAADGGALGEFRVY